MSQRLPVSAITTATLANRPLLFDANILLYLFGLNVVSNNQKWAVNAYSRLFGLCLKNGKTLCVDVFVLSEFINRYLRMEYDNYKQSTGNKIDFKPFRNSPEGIKASQDVDIIVKNKILKVFDVVGKTFDKADILAISLDKTDFNDALLVGVCQEHNCIFVTNDADFANSPIDIISANNRLVPPI